MGGRARHMPSRATGSTVPRRQLGRLLREYREGAGITMLDAYTYLDWSYQRLWRIETGTPGVTIRPVEIEALARFYDVPPDEAEVLRNLASAAKAEGWWQSYSGTILKWSELFFSMEAGASRLRQFESMIVPGLLQAPAYMEAVVRADRPKVSTEKMEARIKVKHERQRILSRSFPAPPEYESIVSEAMLLGELDIPGAMQQQLWHLLKANELAHVAVRVLPLSVGVHPGSTAGSFTILEFPPLAGGKQGEPSTVYSENLTGAIYLDKTDELQVYEDAWSALAELALSKEDSTKMITTLLQSLGEQRS
ncbi:helix-turn-helix domain-containing protein [Actinoplanes sp. HUAS TT8]|uniref:helix-turn-helix domain-containing protein n=1 Tax=Actinoplanes sp. HUAS TT8 TaxID=3447453 RepID=UPI003F51D11C